MADAKQNTGGGQAGGDSSQQQMQLRVPQDLEYVYRDMFNVFGGPSELILEFGNQHRSVPNQASIGNRIVLSYHTASRLQQALTQTLSAVKQKMEEAQKQQAQGGGQ